MFSYRAEWTITHSEAVDTERLIAECGIDCAGCGAYQATITNDDGLRRKTAELWCREYHADIGPQSINCMSCQSTGSVLYQHCTVCEVRACALERSVATCADCSDYGCERLAGLLRMVPEAKTDLEALRARAG